MKRLQFLIVILALVGMSVVSLPASADEPVVRAVLFYSPSCPHCYQALNEVLKPLVEQYGQQLLILALDVTQTDAQAWFQLAAQRYGLEQLLVPTLIIDDVVLIGTAEIEEQFPGLVESHLDQGGADWPDIPGLRAALGTPTPAAEATASPTSTIPVASEGTPHAAGTMAATVAVLETLPAPAIVATSRPTDAAGIIGMLTPAAASNGVVAKLARDPLGNALALVVLAFMLSVVGRVILAVVGRRPDGLPQRAWHGWLLPAMTAVGLVVASYLAYVEAAQVEATCGPVGDCNTVQQSQYARLFGVLPIGVLGLVGYAAILIAWFVAYYSRGRQVGYAQLGMFVMALVGTLFSLYLTFLEPFVIGATCAWCLTSAVLITGLLWLTVAPGLAVLARYGPRYHST